MENRTQQNRQLSPLLFTMFWISQTITLFGDRLNNFSLMALFNNFSENPSLMLAYFYLAMSLPIYLLAPFIGVLVDRLDRGWVLVFTDIARGILVLFIPFLFDRTADFFPIMAIVFLLSTGNLFFLPAKSALIPELVSKERLMKVNSILWGAGIAGVIGGFLGGGFIYDLLSWRACFWLDSTSYFVSAAFILAIAIEKKSVRTEGSRGASYYPSVITAILEGLRTIKNNKTIGRPIGVQTLVWFGAGGFSVLVLPALKNLTAQGSSMGISLAGLAAGLGMGIGSIFCGALRTGAHDRKNIEIFLFSLAGASSISIAFAHSLPSMLAATFVAGFSATPLIVIAESEIQMQSSEGMRGRIFAFREICTRTLFIASAFAFSVIAKNVSSAILFVALGLFLASAGISWVGAFPRHSRESTIAP